MDCVNHTGVAATAYCQNCGKALCAGCVRHGAQGQILCEPCMMAWQAAPNPFAVPPGGPNPTTAGILGLFPGVGAMYNGQFVKGLIHVAIFAVLVSLADHVGIFGLLVAAWVVYQIFEAYHTAKARRDGEPLPDPLGLNELAHNWSNQGRPPYPGVNPNSPDPSSSQPGYPPPPAGGWQPRYQSTQGGTQPGSDQAPYQQPPYSAPYPPPPMPPVPPLHWRRREPIAAIVLIAMGVLFLLGQMNIFNGRLLHFMWPVLLIAVGAWLIVRRVHDSQGGGSQ